MYCKKHTIAQGNLIRDKKHEISLENYAANNKESHKEISEAKHHENSLEHHEIS
jgi:hypothetical protein